MKSVSRARKARERRIPAAGDHILQLFDTDESLARTVADFLASGASVDQRLLVVATPEHWSAIASVLHATSFNVARAQAQGRLTVLDADELLSRFMHRGEPSRSQFFHTVGALVSRLYRESSAGLRIYGEMVELLARDGNYGAAERVEEFWNQLRRRHPFTLLCGYSAAHFAGPDAGSALAAICRRHSHSSSTAGDPLGQFLLGGNPARVATDGH
ncbi:MAG: MEDS domain-containing protein [Vicinamibacterales bacterium]